MLELPTAAAAIGAPPRGPSPFAWFEDLGFRHADLAVFGAARRYAHTRGGATALFCSPPGGGTGPHRLVVADGALPTIAAAACDRRWSHIRYAGVVGAWSEAAALAV